MFTDPSLWVFLAFVSFIVLIGKRGWIALRHFLDQRADRIHQEMEEALRLEKTAYALLESKKQLHHQIHQKTQEILALAQEQMAQLHQQKILDLENYRRQEELNYTHRVQLMEYQLFQELKNKILKIALKQALQKIMASQDQKETSQIDDLLFQNTLKCLETLPLRDNTL